MAAETKTKFYIERVGAQRDTLQKRINSILGQENEQYICPRRQLYVERSDSLIGRFVFANLAWIGPVTKLGIKREQPIPTKHEMVTVLSGYGSSDYSQREPMIDRETELVPFNVQTITVGFGVDGKFEYPRIEIDIPSKPKVGEVSMRTFRQIGRDGVRLEKPAIEFFPILEFFDLLHLNDILRGYPKER